MTEEIEALGKTADATLEVAKTAGKAIDLTEKFGRFLDRVFGDGVTNAVGIVSDRIKYYRVAKAIELANKTDKILRQAGIDTTRVVPPKVALPLIENATLEDEDSLDELWARLLASSLDPADDPVTRKFVTVLSELTAPEAGKFQELAGKASTKFIGEQLFDQTGDDAPTDDALRTFMRLGLIRPFIQKVDMGDGLSGPSILINHDTRKFRFTGFGVSFAKAVNKGKWEE